jgi:hypothetical protein
MSITLNSQIHGSSYGSPTTDNACGCSMLCNQIQGEHTLILRADIKILSYFSNSWGYLKPLYSNTKSTETLKHHGSLLPIEQQQ